MSSIQKTITGFQNGTICVEEFTKTYLARIDAANTNLNAFTDIDMKNALIAAQKSNQRYRDGNPLSMLDGIPVAIENCLAVKGLPHTAGFGGFKSRIAKGDAHVVQKLREAGAIILGTTNMDEGGLGAIGDNVFYGRCKHPQDAALTPGGSCSGAAVAVAANMAMAAVGIDTLGDIRIPASYCGIAGFKPSRNLLDTSGLLPLSWTLDTVGTLAHSALDTFIATAAMLGIPMNPNKLPSNINGMTLGVPWHLLDQSDDLTQGVRLTFENAIAQLKELGATIVPVTLAGYDMAQLRRAAWLICEIEAAEYHLDALRDTPEFCTDNFRNMMHHGLQASDPVKIEALTKIAAAGDSVSHALLHVDAILTPTTPTRAFKFNSPQPIGKNDFTLASNLVGAPSISVPITEHAHNNTIKNGSPVSLQITTDGLHERKAISIAHVFETSIR